MEEAIMLVFFWCMRVEPTMVDYCAEEVSECVADEGPKQREWCQKDYLDIHYINN